MDSNKIKALIVLVISLFAAVYLGVSAATAQLETVMWVLGGSGLIICLALGRRIWMLIPFLGSLSLTLMIPGQPTTILLAHVVFIAFCCALFLMRQLRARFVFTELELWILILTLSILQVYIRNPVGLNIFGADSLGGKPYALFLIALVSSLFFGSLRVTAGDLRWFLRLSIIGGILSFGMQVLGAFIPRVGMFWGAAGLGAGDNEVAAGSAGDTRATRIGFLGATGLNLSIWISSFKSPIRACFHPIWGPLVLLSFAFTAMSGFRNGIAAVGLTYLVGIAYRGGFQAMLLSSFAFLTGLGVLALVNLSTPLPANIQRSLSFLPGTWDEAQVKDAENSTTWRVEMWKEALLTDYWIKNKFLGDGLGMTREEFNFMQSFEQTELGGGVGSGKLTRHQEFFMASGNYHSGPVHTVRTTGYVGLLILVLAQIRLAVHAHRQILRARNTEWFPLTLFLGIPLIWSPIFFFFVFGDFGFAINGFLLGAAYIRLLENNLPLPPYIKRRYQPYVLNQHQQHQHPQRLPDAGS